MGGNMGIKVLVVRQELCTGCMACVEACSLSHEGKTSYRRSRISIAGDKSKAVFVPLMCEMCKAHCQYVCPEGAISFNERLGQPVIDAEKCNGCMKCVRECPFQGITYDRLNHKALMCDLCDGDPVCAKVCQPGALVAVEPTRDSLLEKYENACRKMRVYYDVVEPKMTKYAKRTVSVGEVS